MYIWWILNCMYLFVYGIYMGRTAKMQQATPRDLAVMVVESGYGTWSLKAVRRRRLKWAASITLELYGGIRIWLRGSSLLQPLHTACMWKKNLCTQVCWGAGDLYLQSTPSWTNMFFIRDFWFSRFNETQTLTLWHCNTLSVGYGYGYTHGFWARGMVGMGRGASPLYPQNVKVISESPGITNSFCYGL